MRNEYIRYLNFFLSKNFISYPMDEIDNSYLFFEKIYEDLVEDISFWYPKNLSEIKNNYFNFIQFHSNWEAIFYYRLANSIFKFDQDHCLLKFISSLMQIRTGAQIYYSTNIGRRFALIHSFGVVVGPNNVIGDNFILYQNVTLGQKKNFTSNQNIIIGDDVRIYAGAKLLGPLKITNKVQIGCNSVVNKDIDISGIYAGAPAKYISNVTLLFPNK